MADEPSIACPYCHTTLQPDDMAVFRKGVRIGHLHCWRDYRVRPFRNEGEVPPPDPSSPRGSWLHARRRGLQSSDAAS
jgi:hypothetical protein